MADPNYDTFTKPEKSFEMSTKPSQFDDKSPIMDQILNKNGYSGKTWLNMLLFFVIASIDGIVLLYFNCILIPFRKLYNVSDTVLEIIAGILFIGVALGSIFSGHITEKYSRTIVIKTCSIVIFIFWLFMANIENLVLCAIFRFIMGFANGVNVPIGTNILAEKLPIKLRGFTLVAVWIGFQTATITFILLMLAIMPTLDESQLRLVLSLGSLIILGPVIVLFVFLNDSPRNLILRKQETEAFDQLEEYYQDKINIQTREKIIKEVCKSTGDKEKSTGKFSDLFDQKHLRTTLLLSFIWLITSVIMYGGSGMSSITIKESNEGGNQQSNSTKAVVSLLLQQVVQFGVTLLGAWLVELKFLGRKISMIIGFTLTLIFMILCAAITSQFPLLIGFAIGSVNLPFTIIGAYTSEVYNTNIRDYGVGFGYFSTRLGGVISLAVLFGISEIGTYAPYIFCSVIAAGAIVLIAFLPYETQGMALDGDKDQILKEKKEKKELKKRLKKEKAEKMKNGVDSGPGAGDELASGDKDSNGESDKEKDYAKKVNGNTSNSNDMHDIELEVDNKSREKIDIEK